MENTLFGIPYSTIIQWRNEKMDNIRQLKPLREYELSWIDHEGRDTRSETFTADSYFQDENSLIFHNTGNIVRQYFYPFPAKIKVTPVDEAQIPQ